MLSIGATLKECRELKGVTLGQLAKSSGINKSFLSKIENDKRDPSLTSLNSICSAIGIPLSIFIMLAEDSKQDEFSDLFQMLKVFARNAISEQA